MFMNASEPSAAQILSLPPFPHTLSLTPSSLYLSLSPVPLSLHSQEGRETDLGLIDHNLLLLK